MSTKNHDQFLYDTVNKIQGQLTKFILGTNYTNPYSIYLREQLDNFQKGIEKKHEVKIENKKSNEINPITILPIIKQNINPNLYHHPSIIYDLKPEFKKNNNFNYPLNPQNKYLIKSPLKKEIIEMKNKYLKYSNDLNNRRYYNEKLFDEKGFPIIRNKEIRQGLYNMVTRDLVPKNSDLSPCLNIEGNPLRISSNIIGKRNKYRDEVINLHDIHINSMRYSMEDIYNVDNHFIQNENKNKTNDIIDSENVENKFKNELFITSNNDNNIDKIYEEFNDSYNNKGEGSDYLVKNNDNNIISFINYNPVDDKVFNIFKKKNKNIWEQIENLFDNLSVLFRKLTLNNVQIDTNKILTLLKIFKDHLNNIRNKDLLLCISDQDLIKYGLDPKNEKMFYEKIKEAFIIKIQKMIRRKIAYNKYNILKYKLFQTIKIQSEMRKYIIRKSVKDLLKKEKEYRHIKFIELLNQFKSEYQKIQDSYRVEVHINSLSYDNYKNTTIGKFSEKENLQLNRLIRLIDPNVEIIYISPYRIQEEILRYYFSILENIGISNIEERFHILTPDSSYYFPPNYSLSSLLYFSNHCQKQIKSLIGNKYAYIIPGIPNKIDEEISYLLNIPILMGDYYEIENIFNKSGVKNTFELNNIPFPISAWDIKTEEEFYSSLAHLIATYPTINIWIFKINNEDKGRGIAYINIEKISFIQDLKRDKFTNDNFTIEMFQEALYFQFKNILTKNIKFAYDNFYDNWNDYLKKFLDNKGIIESCPTKNLEGIIGKPCVPILIEPSGNIKILPTFDKVNIENFKNIICTSPQKSMDNNELNVIGEKIGNFLFKQNIIGYVTLEFITFHNGKKLLFWAVDMIYGLTDQICSLQYGYFLYLQTLLNKNKLNEYEEILDNSNNEKLNSELFKEKEINLNQVFKDVYIFTCPILISKYITKLKLKEFLRVYRFENLVFDIEKREGIIFNFPDGLECGIFGICGVINLDGFDRYKGEYRLWSLIEKCLLILKEMLLDIRKKDRRSNNNVYRNDIIDIHAIYSKVKSIAKDKGKNFEHEKRLLNKGNSFI